MLNQYVVADTHFGHANVLRFSSDTRYFARIYASAVMHGCILTPIHPDEMRHYTKNIHGHIHSRQIDDPRYKCVSLEHTGLAPVCLIDACLGPDRGVEV